MNKIRTHDKLYLKSNRFNKPKEYFKLLEKILKKKLAKNREYNLLDIGCANGELIHFLNNKFNNLKFSGMDIRKDLTDLAKKKLPSDIIFKNADITKKQKLKNNYDIIICAGVMGGFDNLDIFFKNIKKAAKENALIFLFCPFNEYDFDILVGYKDLNSKIINYQAGWNLWSIKTIQSFFKKKIIKYPFNISFDVKKNKNDLMRTWTVKVNKKRHFINSTSMLQNQMWLEIKI
jgi:cyclopropane fatty-acyl-phospholipid synthase-like methyltransferase